MNQLNPWCQRILTTKMFYINRVEHPEWSGWSIRKYTVDGKMSFYLVHGQVSHIFVIS